MNPSSMPNQPSSQPGYSGEIDLFDLFDLFQSLWKEKILIVLVTAIFTALAVIYVLTATPIYQAHSSLMPL